MELSSQKLVLAFSSDSPAWRKKKPPGETFEQRLPAIEATFHIPVQTLRLWWRGGVPKGARLLDALCSAMRGGRRTGVVPEDFRDNVSLEVFAGKLGMQICDVRFAMAQELMSLGEFFPARRDATPEGDADGEPRPPGGGLYWLERFDGDDATKLETTSLLTVDRLMRRLSDGGQCAYARLIVPRPVPGKVAVTVEYEGLMLVRDGLAYFALHCRSAGISDLVFVIIKPIALDLDGSTGQYISVHIDNEKVPAGRYVKLTAVKGKGGGKLDISDANIAMCQKLIAARE